MKSIKIEPAKHSPGVTLDPDKNIVVFEGLSLPEDAMAFYLPIITWFHEYKSNCVEKIFSRCTLKITFRLSYYNSATHRAFLEIFNILKQMKEKGLSLTIDWHYEKDDLPMLENGKELSELSELKLTYIEF